MSASMLDRQRAALVVIDIQEGFRKAIAGFDAVVRNAAILVQGARVLGVPVVVTEQYPRGLGDTVAELARHLAGVQRLEKVVFSAAEADGFDLQRRTQALVCGIEAHVCVSQTVMGLLERGIEVHVASDAVSSRQPENRALALDRLERAGAVRSSTETALFELLRRAGTDEFKAIQRLVL
jgi:nicotinamidase-related amidase